MPARTDFRLYHGNDLEVLAGLLAAELARPAPGAALLAPDTILIPQPAMRRWLQKHLAEAHGIAANLRFLAPGEFVAEALKANLPGEDDAPVADARVLRWRLWQVLTDARAMRAPLFAPLAPVLGGHDPALAAWQLAGELAAAFEKYQAWRRDWLRRWDAGGDAGDWQAALWRLSTRGLRHRGQRLDAYLGRFDGDGNDAGAPRGMPARVFAFATQNVSPDVLRVIASSARAGTLHFYFLSPVRGWWGDLQTAAERLRADAGAVFAGDDENPLLRANGAAGRDFVRTLFDEDVVRADFELPVYSGPPAGRTGLLHRLQRDLLERAPPRAAALPLSALADPSLQVHSCHTRLREVQVLHDQLRALLEDDPTLQPRDIAVLAPDIDAYAPCVQAVFGAPAAASAARSTMIPFALADGSALATRPAAEAFAQLLRLPESRFGAEEVLSLLASPAIAERLELESVEFESLREWLRQAGARWGLDGAHRQAVEGVPEPAFSWAWALDRLLLGHATGSEAGIEGIAPLPILGAGQLALLDRFMQGLRRLAHWQKSLATPRTAADWGDVLSSVLKDLFPERATDLEARATIADLLRLCADFAKEASRAHMDATLPASVMRAWFDAALGEAPSRQPLLTGGVTFGRMVPMRLVPFRVICLLGMNDGEFPRREPPGALNRLVGALEGPDRRVGDRSVREDDRALFLQLLAAAGDVFYLSFLGQDPRSGEALAPSVVVSELVDVVARDFADPDRARAAMVVKEALQPFSPSAFGGGDADDGRRVGFDLAWHAGAKALAGERAPAPRFAVALPDSERDASGDWTLEQLLRTLANPAKAFLSEHLGLRLPAGSERLPDSEPFALDDGLDRWQRDGRVLDLCLADPTLEPDALARRMLAEARIAPGAAGREALARSLEAVDVGLRAWRDDPVPAGPLPFLLDLDGVQLSGVLPRVHPSGLRQFTSSKAHGKTLLALGLDALAWSALGHASPIDRVVCGQPRETLAAMPQAQAREQLRALIALAEEARRAPLPFMPKAGLELALNDGPRGLRKALDAWERQGEGKDPWVLLAFRGAEPFVHADATAQFSELARRVFGLLPGVAEMSPDGIGADPDDAERDDD